MILFLPPSTSSSFIIICVYDGGRDISHHSCGSYTMLWSQFSLPAFTLVLGVKFTEPLTPLSPPLPTTPQTLFCTMGQRARLWLSPPPPSIQTPHDHSPLCFHRKVSSESQTAGCLADILECVLFMSKGLGSGPLGQLGNQ